MDPGVWSPVSDVGVDPTLGAPQSEAAEGAELWWAGGRLGVGQPEGLRASVCMGTSYMPNPETWESESQEEPQRLISMEGSDAL